MAQPWVDVTASNPMKARDGVEDWTSELQIAINQLLVTESATLYLPPGIYLISRPLVIANPGNLFLPDRHYLPATITILGEAAGNEGGLHASIIRTAFRELDTMGMITKAAQAPAIIIQSGASVRLLRLVIQGDNHWVTPQGRFGEGLYIADAEPHLFEELGLPDPYVLPGVHTSSSFPHAGVCIDPFHPSVVVRHPSMEFYYDIPGPASRDIVIEDCEIVDFLVGISVAPCGFDHASLPGQMTLTVRHCHVIQSQSAISVSGPRQVFLEGVGLGACKYVINCVDYDGGQNHPGFCPTIYGANIGLSKFVFKTGASGGHATINGIYMESTLSLGQLGSPSRRLGLAEPPPESPNPAPRLDHYRFQGCNLVFSNPDDDLKEVEDKPKRWAPLASMNAHLLNFAHTTFVGCTLTVNRTEGERPPAPLHLANLDEGTLSFIGCHLGGTRAAGAESLDVLFWVSGHQERVSYLHTSVYDVRFDDQGRQSPGPIFLSDIQAVESFHNTLTVPYLGAMTLPGHFYYAFTRDANIDTGLEPGLRWVSGQMRIIPVKPVSGSSFAPGTLNVETRLEMINGLPISAPTGLAIFTAAPGTLQLGDLLTSSELVQGVLLHNPHNPTDLRGPVLLGRVISILREGEGGLDEPADIVTLRFLPMALRNGLLSDTPFHLAYFSRIHPPTTGIVSDSRTVVENITVTPNSSFKMSWGKRQRMFGKEIPQGSYITDVDYMTLKLTGSLKPDTANDMAIIEDARILNIIMNRL